jgi:hypothetical protein
MYRLLHVLQRELIIVIPRVRQDGVLRDFVCHERCQAESVGSDEPHDHDQQTSSLNLGRSRMHGMMP